MDFVAIRSYNNYIDANIVLGRLKDEGINCWLRDENTTTINPVWTLAIGGIKLMVAESQAQQAIELLDLYKKEQRSKVFCPKCGSHNTEWINTPRKAINWFSALLGFLFVNYPMSAELVHHCFDCGHEFPQFNDMPADDSSNIAPG